ncbi:type II secretion system protein [Demequina aurantiaca]|uniref:type II secretion system protein n=1 Tax=Demequina aurantiaca TaxID=676200 RepID=UPI003D32952B
MAMMERIRDPRLRSGDSGFTLVELLVYIVLLAIVGTMVVMLMLNGYKSQLNISQTTQNSGDSQNAIKAITYDVRYSSASKISPSGNLLVTRTWVGDPETGTYVCRGWFYDDATKKLRRATTSAATSGANATTASAWTQYVEGVTATSPFSTSGSDGVRVSFTGTPAAWGRDTGIDTVISPRPQTDTESAPCF